MNNSVRIKIFNFPMFMFFGMVVPSALLNLNYDFRCVLLFVISWLAIFVVRYNVGSKFLWVDQGFLYIKQGVRKKKYSRSGASIAQKKHNGKTTIKINTDATHDIIKLPFYMPEAHQEDLFNAIDKFCKENNIAHEK